MLVAVGVVADGLGAVLQAGLVIYGDDYLLAFSGVVLVPIFKPAYRGTVTLPFGSGVKVCATPFALVTVVV